GAPGTMDRFGDAGGPGAEVAEQSLVHCEGASDRKAAFAITRQQSNTPEGTLPGDYVTNSAAQCSEVLAGAEARVEAGVSLHLFAEAALTFALDRMDPYLLPEDGERRDQRSGESGRCEGEGAMFASRSPNVITRRKHHQPPWIASICVEA
ncbi:MAG TPA: hypothetical protein VF214_08145, partial [Edaphobacter sp.]